MTVHYGLALGKAGFIVVPLVGLPIIGSLMIESGG